MGDWDIWAAALLLIERHGDDAAMRALKRVGELSIRSDTEGIAVLLRIVTVIREIEASGTGGPIH